MLLLLLGVPSVTLSQTSFSGNYGEAITLGCIISSNPVYTSVYWQKTVAGTDPITIDLTNTDKYSGSTVTDPDLTIKNLGSGDIATYVCFAANSVGTGRSNSSPLNVVGSKYLYNFMDFEYKVSKKSDKTETKQKLIKKNYVAGNKSFMPLASPTKNTLSPTWSSSL